MEFFQWCEDLRMEPILGIYAGFSALPEVATPEQLKQFVQDAVDEIEYVTGDAKTTWGARRAADGHPAPFPLRYVEIGNEDGGFGYPERFAAFFDAIKAKYPELKVIATCDVPTRRADIVDEHLYARPETMLRKTDMYDHRDPKLPPVFVGEWATSEGKYTSTFRGALCDAAWLTALQRNSETVVMNCYAPLFVNAHHVGPWEPNLIGFEAANSHGSASYYAQAMTSLGLEPGWQTHAYSSSYRWDSRKFPADFPEVIRRQGYDLYLWCQAYIDPASPLLPFLGKRFGDFDVWRGVVPDLADAQVRQTYSEFLLRTTSSARGLPVSNSTRLTARATSAAATRSGSSPSSPPSPAARTATKCTTCWADSGRKQLPMPSGRRTGGRSGWCASQAWAAPVPMVIYSDEYDFPDYIRYNLSAGVQGLLWTPEVRDVNSERDWALRVAAAAFSARMLYNGWQFPHFLWQQPNLSANEHHQLLPPDNPYIRIARRFNRLRMVLLPYLYQACGDYHRKGISPVRPLVADWAEDSNTWHIDDQWMLGGDLLVAPLTDANSFSTYRRRVVDDAKQFRPLNGPCRVTGAGGAIELAMDFDGLGIKGAQTSLELQAGPCMVRFAYRADAGSAGVRLWTPAGQEVPEFHVDELPATSGWQVGVVRATLPTAGTYWLYLGKAHVTTGARHISFRNITVTQRPLHQDAKAAWSREVYLPEGQWRDFWTGKVLKGGQHQVVTAAAERPAVFVREGTLLPLAEPLLTMDGKSVLTVHLAAYGDNPRPCKLLEDDGITFDFEKGKWATLTLEANGTIGRPDHGQPPRYRIAGKAEPPECLLQKLLGAAE